MKLACVACDPLEVVKSTSRIVMELIIIGAQ